MNHNPRVSIGLPVWNGENYLEGALRSICAQTFQDFELIISDNASEDRTEVISREWAAKDPRIRYIRNDKNVGAAKNFNQVFEWSTGEYFKWAAHDDELAPTFLERCVQVLDEDPSVVLCHSLVVILNEHNEVVEQLPHDLTPVHSAKPQVRFSHLLLTDRSNYDLFGLLRAPVLRQTQLFAGYACSDLALRAELGLRGPYFQIPEVLFYARRHPQTASHTNQSHLDWAVWSDPENAGKRLFPHWRIFLEYYKTIGRVPLTNLQRLGCSVQLVRWVFSNLNWGRMLLELIITVAPGVWTVYWKFRQKLLQKLGNNASL